MPKYRKKPVVVEAFKLQDKLDGQTPDWFLTAIENKTVSVNWSGDGYLNTECLVKTPEGTMIGYEGDYIIKGILGELYPCKPDIFAQTYEMVVEIA